jgi:DNA sulfur modification protein DndC
MSCLTFLERLDSLLREKVKRTWAVFDELDKKNKYLLAFSGGKDSTALLLLYFLWTKQVKKRIDIKVINADTMLESHKLISYVDVIRRFCDQAKIPFEIVVNKRSFWDYLIARGLGVPSIHLRWCTNLLKISPMKVTNKNYYTLIGTHYGESVKRDISINKRAGENCGSNECGVDKISTDRVISPILEWTNCNVWDFLFMFNDFYGFEIFNTLQEMYKENASEQGSLRMGCVICPVISEKTLFSNSYKFLGINSVTEYKKTMDLIYKLRLAKQIVSPKTGKSGATHIDARRYIWKEIPHEFLIRNGYLKIEEKNYIDKQLLSDYAYPKNYTQEHIDEQHRLCANLPLFDEQNNYLRQKKTKKKDESIQLELFSF